MKSALKAWPPLLLAVVALVLGNRPARAGTWQALANAAPGRVQMMMLLTDGSVMCFDGNTTNWYRLAPDATGSYVNGIWSTLASMSDTRRYFASQVLQNGKVMVAGGEYGAGCGTAELYDPLANTWNRVTIPAGLLCACPQTDGTCGAFRDAGSVLLPDGTMMVAPVFPATANGTLIYDPVANSWAAGPACLRNQNEATWVKLPDDSILTVDKNSTQSERFIPGQNQWVNDATVPVQLYGAGSEVGPALLLPDGRAWFIGGTTNTALYTPSGTASPGTWAAGPVMPDNQACPDAPAAMLVNGHALVVSSPVGTATTPFPTPASFYEYDPQANSFTRQPSPTGGLTQNIPSFQASLLCLPDGTVLYSSETNRLFVYVPVGGPIPAWRPSITGVSWHGDGTMRMTGRQLNGLSQGASYGDDIQMDSNYPLVRFGAAGLIHYARTYNWSSTSVATGTDVVSTDLSLPPDILYSSPNTVFTMTAVANGIPSLGNFFYGPVWVDFAYGGLTQTGAYATPYKTLALGRDNVLAGGNLLLKGNRTSGERPFINKAMKISAIGGPVTIGQ